MREVFVLLAHLLMTLVKPTGWTVCGSGRVAGGEASTVSHESIAPEGAKTHTVGQIALWFVRYLDATETPGQMRNDAQTFELYAVSQRLGAV